jgi:adenylyltransferase/sulfurtransferase
MPPPGTLQTCDTAGVIAPIVNVIASLQCTEALKYLTGRHDKLRKGLLNVDLWENTFVPVGLSQPREACPACQQREYTYLKGEHAQQTTVLCGRNTVQVMPASPSSIDLGQLATQLSPHGKVTQNPFLLRLALEDKTITVFPDGRALIEGTKQAAEARSLYARYIGA